MTGPTKRKWPKRLLWGTAALFVLLLASLAGARAMFPWLVKRVADEVSRQHLGLPLEIGNVDLRLRAGEILLENVRVNQRSGGVGEKPVDAPSSLLEIPRIAVRFSWSELWKKRVTLTSFAIDGPVLHLAREADGSIDPFRHAAPEVLPQAVLSGSSHAPAKTEVWPVLIRSLVLRTPKVTVGDARRKNKLLEFSLESFELDEVSVERGDLALGSIAVRGPHLWVHRAMVGNDAAASSAESTKDKVKPAPSTRPGLRIRDVDVQRAKFTWEGKEGPLDVLLTLKVSEVTVEAKAQFPIEMTLQTGSGKMTINGDAGIFPPFFQGKVAWHELSFPPLLLAVRPDLIEWLQSASSSGMIDLVLDSAGLKGSPVIHVSGKTSLENLSAAAPGNNRVTLGCRRLDLVINKLVYPLPQEGAPSRPIVADLASVRADTPWLVYAHPASVLELQGDSNEPFLAEASIGRLELTGGDIKLHDTTVSAVSGVSNLTVMMENASYPDLTCSFLSVQAGLPAAAQFTLEGSVKPGRVGDFRISLQNLELPAWNPYAKSFGVSLDAGTVSLQTKLAFAGPALQADNDVTLRWVGVSLPKTAAFAIGLPIDLAIALLRDPAGDIKLSVPVRMDEGGATLSKNEVFGSALKAAFVGALSSPLKVLTLGGKKPSKVVPVTPLSIPVFACAAGSAELGEDATARVRKIVKLLAERPELYFKITGITGPLDRPILAEQILVEQAKAGEKLPRVKDAGFLAMRRIGIVVGKRAKGEETALDENDRPIFERVLAEVDIPQDRFDALATDRAEKLKSLLVKNGAEASRLWIETDGGNGESGALLAFHVSQKKPETKPRRKAQAAN